MNKKLHNRCIYHHILLSGRIEEILLSGRIEERKKTKKKKVNP